MTTISDTNAKNKLIFGHPPGLFVLFFTEMWERFSYYGMRALLVLYMSQYLLATPATQATVFGLAGLQHSLESLFGPLSAQALASQIYGLYTGLVYFTPFFGGMLADQWLGQRKTVLLGGVLMAAGHFLMMLESCFLAALLLLILGNGCFKPNISTQVGSLYPLDDPRRDGAFTIFYMGINLGAFFSPLVCGTLGQLYGWHYGFAAAGLGMLSGLLVFWSGRKYLHIASQPVSYQVQPLPEAAPLSRQQWFTIAGLLVLAVLNILFWAVYEQQGNSIQLFVEYHTRRTLWGWEMPSSWYQALNPAMIMVLAPWLDNYWRHQALRGTALSSISKMAVGAVLLGLGFLVMVVAVSGVDPALKISFVWLFVATLIMTLGELYLSPVGLSLVCKAAPPKLVGMLMGMWFLSAFFGNYLAGYLGSFYERMARDEFFLLMTGLGGITGLAIFALRPLLERAVGRG